MAKTKKQVEKEKVEKERTADLERREAAVAEKEAEFDVKEKAVKVTAEAKGKEELERLADEARKADVDATNKRKAAESKAEEDELASTPLNDEEVAFIARIRPMMNKGRKVDQPAAADILRYSKLIKREKV